MFSIFVLILHTREQQAVVIYIWFVKGVVIIYSLYSWLLLHMLAIRIHAQTHARTRTALTALLSKSFYSYNILINQPFHIFVWKTCDALQQANHRIATLNLISFFTHTKRIYSRRVPSREAYHKRACQKSLELITGTIVKLRQSNANTYRIVIDHFCTRWHRLAGELLSRCKHWHVVSLYSVIDFALHGTMTRTGGHAGTRVRSDLCNAGLVIRECSWH